MSEDFVSFDIAKKLKEKGFKLACIGHYEGDRFEYNTYDGYDINIGYIARSYNDDNRFDEYTDLPVICQVLKWLREENKIYIVIAVNPTLSTKDKIAYYYQVYSNSNGVTSDYYESEECYAQWEECAIDSIKYVLGNLI